MNRSFVLLLVASALSCAGGPYVAGRRTAPAARSGIHHTEFRLPVDKDVSLLVQTWRPESGPEKASLLIVHGLKDYGDRYAEFAASLVERGYVVHTFDLRGHGDSSGDRVWVKSFETYLDDLSQVMRYVRQVDRGAPIFLFGHSMGGAISTLYAIDRRADLAGLIVSAGALKIDNNAVVQATTRILGGLTPRLAVFSLDDTKFSRDERIVSSMKNDPLISDGAAPARTAASVIHGVDALRSRANELTCPLLALHGSADEVTPPAGSADLVAAVSSKDRTLKAYDGYFHDLLHEPNHEQIVSDIAGWMDAHVAVTTTQK